MPIGAEIATEKARSAILFARVPWMQLQIQTPRFVALLPSHRAFFAIPWFDLCIGPVRRNRVPVYCTKSNPWRSQGLPW